MVADADSPREDTITVQSRGGIRYQLALAYDRTVDPGAGKVSTPAADVAAAADQVLISNPSDVDRSVAGLLNYVAATWEKQDIALREHAQAVARDLTGSRTR
ncbi:hypothetical protein [Streptomyces anulatus]|uniref:hypothetical protein n=1 Tax=Streptomyces anulatus TaxID=1892 RepID=UPI0004C79535|nr:hypothetical protein [Streptomyces anulatus]